MSEKFNALIFFSSCLKNRPVSVLKQFRAGQLGRFVSWTCLLTHCLGFHRALLHFKSPLGMALPALYTQRTCARTLPVSIPTSNGRKRTLFVCILFIYLRKKFFLVSNKPLGVTELTFRD